MKLLFCLALLALVYGFASAAFRISKTFLGTQCSGSPVSVSGGPVVGSCTPTPCFNISVASSVSGSSTCEDTLTLPSTGRYVISSVYVGDSTCSNSSTIVSVYGTMLDTCVYYGQQITGDVYQKFSLNGTHANNQLCKSSDCTTLCEPLPAQPLSTCTFAYRSLNYEVFTKVTTTGNSASSVMVSIATLFIFIMLVF